MNIPYYAEHLAYIAKVTEMLNQLPSNDDFYIGVKLYSTEDHQQVGEWSDEIAPDAWYYKEGKA